ncbi:hypothetical protein N8746_03895 [Alphaproteobacteria bacterium]|nr:hypothetical protein [Alphaproteobacteria bacterium]
MKLTITARSRDDFDVIANNEELHKIKQSIFKVNITDADLHELTKSRVDKDHLIEFAFIFLLEREPVDTTQSAFNMKTISHYFPEFPKAVKSWVNENTE